MSQADPGDLGRRVTERRVELGLSREEVARRAGMDPGYLEYLEQDQGATAGTSTLYRLAAALETTVARLHGEGFGQPVGSGTPPGGTAELEVMDRGACLELIRRGGVGRVVFVDSRGPVALPVNFRLLDDDILLRTGEGSIRAAVEATGIVSLEADHLDDTLGEGWSVLVTGHGVVVTDPDELRRADEVHIESWAGGQRPTTVRLVAEEITGRRIRRHL